VRVRRDSFSLFADTIRWRVALVLGVLIALLMVVLGFLNISLGQQDMAALSWAILAVVIGCLVALVLLPRRLGGTLFFGAIAALLVLAMVFGHVQQRPMQHWGYIFPPLIAFLLRPGPALAAMIGFGLLVLGSHWTLLSLIERVRFGSAYGLLVGFTFTYALLQHHATRLLRYHSEHDALTNCLNRRTFNALLQQLHLAGDAAAASPCCFLLIDIDHFKSINDQHGHLVGDRVITEVAAGLGRALDAETPLFRYGGEEFAVLLRDTALPGGVALAERLRQAVAGTPFVGMTLTISVGVAEWRPGRDGIESALGRADGAMYEAKRSGRNRVAAVGAASPNRAPPAEVPAATAS
jgi:diguanylate cyclase (GGDEF)-like protein